MRVVRGRCWSQRLLGILFEQPRQLARQMPALYAVLRAFYNLDLASHARPRIEHDDDDDDDAS